MDITPKTKLLDLLNEFPEIENKIMSLAPPFKNLKNPILRKTVGKLATLEKVATIGGLDVGDFMNEIRNDAVVISNNPVTINSCVLWRLLFSFFRALINGMDKPISIKPK